MCGICGIFHKENQVDAHQLDTMLKFLFERGPENNSKYIEQNVGLGHSRLSIIDLNKRANQPFVHQDTKNVICYNGEIYNYREIKKELIQRGIKFRTESDTEVILEAYQAWGLDKTLSKLDGMFAFSIYDYNLKELFLARDPFGKKPLYYFFNDGSLFFSSDIRSIWAINKKRLTIDWESIDYYLSELSVPQPKTIWKEIRQIKPAHYAILNFEDFNFSEHRYWNLWLAEELIITPQEALEQTNKLLKNAISKRLESDVPLGFFLSGGIDSGLVVAIAAGLSRKPLRTLTVTVDDSRMDESEYAATVARKYGTDHSNVHVTADIDVSIAELITYTGEPFADSSLIPSYLITKAAKGELTVMLSGDGGDELFGGYYDYGLAYRTDDFLDKIRYNRFKKATVLVDKFMSRMVNRENMGSYDHFASIPGGQRLRRNMGFAESEKAIMYMHSELKAAANFTNDYLDKIWNRNESKRLTDTLMRSSLETRLLNDYLVKIDRASMRNSIEVRSPFLDKKLAEFAFSLDYKLKFFKGENKSILRTLAKQYLGEASVSRPKTGFGIPLHRWLRKDLKIWRNELFNSFGKRQIIDPIFMQHILNDHDRFNNKHTHKIWSIICLELWLQEFYD